MFFLFRPVPKSVCFFALINVCLCGTQATRTPACYCAPRFACAIASWCRRASTICVAFTAGGGNCWPMTASGSNDSLVCEDTKFSIPFSGCILASRTRLHWSVVFFGASTTLKKPSSAAVEKNFELDSCMLLQEKTRAHCRTIVATKKSLTCSIRFVACAGRSWVTGRIKC